MALEVSKTDLKKTLKKNGWKFNWSKEFNADGRIVYKLIRTDQPEVIQGLVSISNMGDHFYLHAAESAPINFGNSKSMKEWAVTYSPFCCKLSWDNGNDGIIAFKSKIILISHYERTLGAFHIGNHNMIIYPEAALILIRKYLKQ